MGPEWFSLPARTLPPRFRMRPLIPLILVSSLAVAVVALVAARAPTDRPSRPPRPASRSFAPRSNPWSFSTAKSATAARNPRASWRLQSFLKRADVLADRQVWEKISQKLRSGEMPPEEQPQPAADARKTAAAWIDTALSKFDCGRERDPGRVTIRRLNRNEYNNTIRDLVGVDFHPADDFPSDDVGYGFDNIGDVLSMPPLLLEKYLAAAQKIVDRALGTEQVNLITGEIEGGQIIEGGAPHPAQRGRSSHQVSTLRRGDYILRVRAYGEQAGDEPVKMGVYLDNKLVRSFDVRADRRANRKSTKPGPRSRAARTRFRSCSSTTTTSPTKPEPNDRNLIIERPGGDGPLSARPTSS